MIIVANDYWKNLIDQETGSKPLDKVEIELTAGTWTDVTEYYMGGARFSAEKEKAPDIITAGDTRYSFDNSENTFTPSDSSSIFYNVIYIGKKIRFSEGFHGIGYFPQSTMIIRDIKWSHNSQIAYILAQESTQKIIEESLNSYPTALVPVAGSSNVGNGVVSQIETLPFVVGNENWTLTASVLVDNSNKFFDFNIGGGELNATIATGTYPVGATQADAGSFCKALYDAIVAQDGAGTYTVSYASASQEFTLTRSAGTFNILWKTGVHGSDNTDTHVGTTMGFDDSTDDTGSLSYTSDNPATASVFSVVGSVSGNVGTATVGTEFSDGTTGGIRFTISAGGTSFAFGDTFTFTTYQYPEWTNTNPAKIIWSICTGYNFDTDVQEAWSARVLSFDHTKSVDNTDMNYTSFLDAISRIDNNLTGYIDYDRNAAETIEEIIIHFLGALYVDNRGKISLSAYKPTFGGAIIREFSDEKKVYDLEIEESTSKIINVATAYCKSSATWAWSGDDETTDDVYSNSNSTSISNYGARNQFTFTDYYWYSANKAAQIWFVDRIIDKFGLPPKEIEFLTGLDGMRQNLGDILQFADARTSNSGLLLEINKIERDFESQPKTIEITAWNTNTTGFQWMFFGSSADEGDGISPQTANYDSATLTDKQFGYWSTTGSTVQPLYYYF